MTKKNVSQLRSNIILEGVLLKNFKAVLSHSHETFSSLEDDRKYFLDELSPASI